MKKETKIITTINQKGGVGKTTTIIMLTKLLALQKRKILLIDLDDQGNLSSSFGYDSQDKLDGTYDLFTKYDAKNVIQKTENENIDIIISNKKSSLINEMLVVNKTTEEILKNKLKELANNKYHYVFIDCPATINALIKTALAASDIILVPINADKYSIDGIPKLINVVEEITNKNKNKVFIKLFINKYEQHLKSHQNIYEGLRKSLPNYMCKNTILKRSDVQKTIEQIKDIYKLNNKKAVEIANQYIQLFNEVRKNGSK